VEAERRGGREERCSPGVLPAVAASVPATRAVVGRREATLKPNRAVVPSSLLPFSNGGAEFNAERNSGDQRRSELDCARCGMLVGGCRRGRSRRPAANAAARVSQACGAWGWWWVWAGSVLLISSSIDVRFEAFRSSRLTSR
jgi:hypothetical protein